MGVITRLVLGGSLGSIGRDLLQERGNSRRSRRACLVEEGDDIFGFVLEDAVVSQWSLLWTWEARATSELTNRNIFEACV